MDLQAMIAKKRSGHAGFTLVEIAIVLVIIGLLLGAVLKGQELIENSRTKRAANMIQSISAAYYGYLDRYGQLPGDEGPVATLQDRGGNWTNITAAGNGNGVLNVACNPWTVTCGEITPFFQHLRAAGFLTGDAAATSQADLLPRNPWGGLTSVSNLNNQGRESTRFLQVCMGSVPGKAARALDVQLDNGRPQDGIMRATRGVENVAPGTGAPTDTTYSEDHLYTICVDIG